MPWPSNLSPSIPTKRVRYMWPGSLSLRKRTGMLFPVLPKSLVSASTSNVSPIHDLNISLRTSAPTARYWAARARRISIGTIGIKAAGVLSRGEYGKTCKKLRRHSRINDRV